MKVTALVPAMLAAASLSLAACGGGSGEDRPERAARLLLDSPPRAVHAGIYLTVAREFDAAEGVELDVVAPAPTVDPAAQLLDGRAQLAVLDVNDLARARTAGRDVVGVMALVQQPLGADEGSRAAPRPPQYPQLVLAASRETSRDDPAVVRAAVRALRRGYREALLDPESAVTALVDAEQGLDRARVQRQFEAVEPAFTSAPGGFGALDRGRLRAWARWAARAGIVELPPDVDRAFDFSFASG